MGKIMRKEYKIITIICFLFISLLSWQLIANQNIFALDNLNYIAVKTNTVYDDRSDLSDQDKAKLVEIDQCVLGNVSSNSNPELTGSSINPDYQSSKSSDNTCPTGQTSTPTPPNQTALQDPNSTQTIATCDSSNPQPFINSKIIINNNKVDSSNRDAVVESLLCAGAIYKRTTSGGENDNLIPTQCQNVSNESVIIEDIKSSPNGNIGTNDSVIRAIKVLLLKRNDFMISALTCDHPRLGNAIANDHASYSALDIIPRKSQDSNTQAFKDNYNDLKNFFINNLSNLSGITATNTVSDTVLHLKVDNNFNPDLSLVK